MSIFNKILPLMASCLALAAPLRAEDKPPQPIKALLITGGCCHDYTTQKNVIAKGLEERAHIQVTVVQQGGTATNSFIEIYKNPDWAKGYDIVLHDECFSDAADKNWTQRILSPHQDGLPAVVIHCAMHCYRDGTDEWFKFCGVTSRRHGAGYPHEVLNRNADHPIMRDFGPAWANPAGELYWIEKVWDTATPLAVAKNREKGNEEVCVWTNQYGKTRVFGTTLGHHNETVAAEPFLDLLTRGTLWACDKLNDAYLKKREPKLIPVNIALGKKATASSEETGKNNFAPHAVDGKPSTRWCASGGGYPQRLQLDLGEATKLTGCELLWESPQAVYRYRIEGSLDGQEWATLVDASQNSAADYRHQFDGTYRHLKLECLGCTLGGQWASIWEWKVFGDKTEIQAVNVARPGVDQSLLADLKIPDGYEATIFASPPAVSYPVYVAAAPDGVVYVSVDKNGSLDRETRRGAVYRLRDVDGDGQADEVKLFVPNVDSPRGLVWDRDRLYLMHPPHLSAFIDRDGDGIAEEQQTLVKNIAFGFKDRPADHTSNGVTLGVDGWLYLAIGDFGFMQAEGTDGRKMQLRGGGVVRVRPDGSGLELYSRGTRNILEVALDPLLNGYTRDNTNDGGGWDIRLHHFTGLEDHGYPSRYLNFKDEIVAPLADYGGGSGCGALFLSEPGFPGQDGHALYTADWGRQQIFQHLLTPNGATVKPSQREFLFSTRVTDLDVDASSRLFVTSWKGATFTYNGEDVGYLALLKPKGYQPPALPDYAKLTPPQLVAELGSPSHRRRLAAQRELLQRTWTDETAPALQALAGSTAASLESRVIALFTLKQKLGVQSHPTLAALSRNEALLPYCIRALTDRWDQQEGVPADVLRAGLKSPAPRARLEAVVAIGRLGDKELAGDLTALLTDADPIIAHTTVQSLIRLEATEACLRLLDQPSVADNQAGAALRALQELHQPVVVRELTRRLGANPTTVRRRQLLSALCRLYFQEGEWKGNSWGTRPDTRGPYYQPEPWSETDGIRATLAVALNDSAPEVASHLVAELSRHRIELSGSLAAMLELAGKDPALLPVAIRQLVSAESIPPAALPLLGKTVQNKELPAAVRAGAVTALIRSGDASQLPLILQALQAIPQSERNVWATAQETFLTARNLEPFRDALVKRGDDKAAAVWAYAGLLTLADGKQSSAEARALAAADLEKNWSIPAQRKLILEAALLANHREYESRVIASLSHENAEVRQTAEKIVKEWKLSSGPTPAGPAVKTLPPEKVLAEVLQLQGGVSRGQAVFKRLECAKCHTITPGEALRGPHLPQVAKTYKRLQLAEAVLQPSKSIAQGFVTNVFLMADGKTYTGFITSEAADIVTIRDEKGLEHRLPVGDIEERVKQTVSIMPNGLVDEISLEDFAALVDYLESLKDQAEGN